MYLLILIYHSFTTKVVHLRRFGAVTAHAQAHQQQESQLLAMLIKDLTRSLSVLDSKDSRLKRARYPVLLVASCEDEKELPTKLQSVFSHQVW
eukprot:1356063-Amorphochlora_amoeboformis.AAC.1